MPELPEVETVVRGLRRHILGDVIVSVWLSRRPQPLKSPPAEIAAVLEGARIVAVRRMGKHIVFDLGIGRSGDPVIEKPHHLSGSGVFRSPDHPITRSPDTPDAHFIVHLGMTGQLRVATPDDAVAKHTHLIARLESGRELRFIDPRMFGKLAVVREPFQTAGKEPLDVPFEAFAALFRGRKTPIKSALLNQNLLRGIGNIYADESLFRARLRPRRRAASLTRAELARLHRAIAKVLNQAIAAGGSSVSDYVGAGGERGFFQFQHRVYGRAGEPCVTCGTPIKRIVVAGRGTHYCPRCQR